MDLQINNIVEFVELKICRCCLGRGSFREINMEYSNNNQKEVYEDMLRSTLNIELSHHNVDGYVSVICEECILKLREATLFKENVLNSENKLIQLVTKLKETKTDVYTLKEIKVKTMSVMEFGEDSCDDDDDNEILANVKLELPQTSTILDQTDATDRQQSKIKKCKMRADLEPNQKNWTKIAEHRGTGPILRENSLKLLANSTLIVFQWNKSRYRCFCCNEPFSDVISLKEHTNSKHNLKEIEKKIINQQNRLVKVEITDLKCNCGERFYKLTDLRTHLVRSHDIKFESNEDLLVPFKLNDEFICQICNEQFYVFRLLNIHMNKHYQKQVCHVCGAGFSNLVFLNLHKTRSHKPLKCRHCDMMFDSKVDKRNHEIHVHSVKFERKLRFPCPYCSDRFFQENFRVQHLVDKHGLKRPEFRCNICSKVFITKSLCNNHMKNVHMKQKCHECDICHNCFYTKSDVLRHKVTHTGEKKYSCTVCHNPFASKDSLKRHMRRTHGVN